MSNYFGNYSLYIALIASIYLIIKSYIDTNINIKNLNKNLVLITSVQTVMIIISFISLVVAFIISDFSNETVFNNSHTLKPLFYKISGSWGNHEGSLLLWLLVLSVFLYIFLLKSSSQNIKYRLLTLLFQQIIISGFLIFILLTSNGGGFFIFI